MSHQTEREAVNRKLNLENSEHGRHRFDDVKKGFENSAATDSGYLSAPNITCSSSDIDHSSSDIAIPDSRFKSDDTSTEQKKTTATFDPDSGFSLEDDSSYSHDNIDKEMIVRGPEESFFKLPPKDYNKLDGKQSNRLSEKELLELIFRQDDDGDT